MTTALQGKHLLLDTNLLIHAARYKDNFDSFFHELVDLDVQSVIDLVIKFEFLRGSNTRENIATKQEFLDTLLGKDRLELAVDVTIFQTATELSNIYFRKNPTLAKQISFADCLIGAQMKKYNEMHAQMFLATTDNWDFPLFVFDRIDIFTLDVGKEIFTIGIYRFDNDRYKKLRAELY